MIRKGLLSELKLEPELTDDNILTNDYNKRKKIIKDNMKKLIFNEEQKKIYGDCYYYLTGDKYKNLQKLYNDKEDKYKSYFDTLVEEMGWYKMPSYTMDWLCQIKFFYNYSNNRVMFVTGSTGAGKSTQVPKLLLYAQSIAA